MRRQKLNQIIRQAIAGDAGACEQLCELYARTILFQSRLLLRNKAEAEDVAQRVAIDMLRDIQKLKSPYAFRSWLQRLIVNSCSKQNARTQRELEHSEVLDQAEWIVDESFESRPEEDAISSDMQRFIGGYLDKLPSAQAVALTLYYYEQLSYKEIAATMGVSVGSVSSTISKAKKNLRKLLKEKNDAGALGITFVAPFLQSELGKVVFSEVHKAVPEESVNRLLSNCSGYIASTFTTGAVTATAASGIGNSLLASSAAVVILGGIGAGAYYISQDHSVTIEEETPAPIVVEQPQYVQPDTRITYSVSEGATTVTGGEVAVNPLTAELSLYSDETLSGWSLMSAGNENEILFSGEGQLVDITTMNLKNGHYVINWYLESSDGVKSRAYWTFSIVSDQSSIQPNQVADPATPTQPSAPSETGQSSEPAPSSEPTPSSEPG